MSKVPFGVGSPIVMIEGGIPDNKADLILSMIPPNLRLVVGNIAHGVAECIAVCQETHHNGLRIAAGSWFPVQCPDLETYFVNQVVASPLDVRCLFYGFAKLPTHLRVQLRASEL